MQQYAPGVGVAIAFGHILSVAFPPLLLVAVGGLVGRGISGSRRAKAEAARTRNDVRIYVQVVIRDLGVEVPATLRAAVGERVQLLGDAISTRIAERRDELTATLRQIETAKRASDEEVARSQAAAPTSTAL